MRKGHRRHSLQNAKTVSGQQNQYWICIYFCKLGNLSFPFFFFCCGIVHSVSQYVSGLILVSSWSSLIQLLFLEKYLLQFDSLLLQCDQKRKIMHFTKHSEMHSEECTIICSGPHSCVQEFYAWLQLKFEVHFLPREACWLLRSVFGPVRHLTM